MQLSENSAKCFYVPDSGSARFALGTRLMCSGLFFTVCAYCMYGFLTSINKVRRAAVNQRFHTCSAISVIVTMSAALSGLIQASVMDDIVLTSSTGSATADLCRMLEWTFTCPLMITQCLIFAGPSCKKVASYTPALTIIGMQVCGGLASVISQDAPVGKFTFFVFGCFFFIYMVYLLNNILLEVSEGQVSLLRGWMALKSIYVLLITTWLPFPVLWLMSPEGYSAGVDELGKEGVEISVIMALANFFSKSGFVIGMQVVKSQLKEEELARNEEIAERQLEAAQSPDHKQAPDRIAARALTAPNPAPNPPIVGRIVDEKARDADAARRLSLVTSPGEFTHFNGGGPQDYIHFNSSEDDGAASLSDLVWRTYERHGSSEDMADVDGILENMKKESIHTPGVLKHLGREDFAALGIQLGMQIHLVQAVKRAENRANGPSRQTSGGSFRSF